LLDQVDVTNAVFFIGALSVHLQKLQSNSHIYTLQCPPDQISQVYVAKLASKV